MPNRKRIMIVEDEGLIASDIAGHIEKAGHAVAAIASSGEEALNFLEQSSSDLILMDIRLKGKLDGIDTALRIRESYNIPLIFLTSHADRETLARAREAVPFGYLAKPFRPVNLCSAIEMALFKHQSEKALLEREAWLSTVLESTADATIVTDMEGLVQFLNPSAESLLGWPLAEAAGQPWSATVPLVDGDTEAVTRAIQQGLSTKLEEGLLKRRDGEQVVLEGEVAPSMMRGRIAGAVVTLRDVSVRKRRELELRQHHKALAIERMAGGVAHDFNNLLTVILGQCEVLAGGMREPQDKARLEAILEAARTAGGITRQLLTLCGKLVLATEGIDVNDSVRRMVNLLANNFGERIQVSMELAPGLGLLRMNPAQLDQVLLNLLVNARDAMPDGGVVRVSTSPVHRLEREGGTEVRIPMVMIRVQDGGHGVAAEAREHLFEPFFTTKGHGKGMGLGLAIVHGIVKDAGGEIVIESQEGEGATFEVLLPMMVEGPYPESRAADQGGAESLAEPNRRGGRTILLADDQPAILFLITAFLKEHGFHILTAGDGRAALELANGYEGHIDLLISDVLMPEMNGLALARELSLVRPGIPTLLMSGDPGQFAQAVRDAGLESGFLQKPFGLPQLLAKVQEMTAARAATASTC